MALARSRGAAPPPLPPRKPTHLQQQHKPLALGSRRAKYNCSCGTLHGTIVCSCSTCHTILHENNSSCSYYSRCVEPLAWNIEHELVRTQDQCPLFTVLPREIRDLIFAFALTDAKAQSPESLMKRLSPRNFKGPVNDLAINLLHTCRAIYLETWALPLSLNLYIAHDVHHAGLGRSGVKLYTLLPWQLAFIQGLDITLSQMALEGDSLHNYIHCNNAWHPNQRHQGAYVAPRWYRAEQGARAMTEFLESFDSTLVPVEKVQQRHFLSHVLGEQLRYPTDSPPPWSSAMRVMRANPITQLTLRIHRTDWWTWTDDPNSTDESHHLGLDPSVGDGGAQDLKRPTASRMRALAELRRAGHYPEIKPDVGWADTIARMPDLRSLELVLETFALKKRQLDDVVEAAKTWKFALDGGLWELVWDGEVGMSSWSRCSFEKAATITWYQRENAFKVEVRNMRFTRRRAA